MKVTSVEYVKPLANVSVMWQTPGVALPTWSEVDAGLGRNVETLESGTEHGPDTDTLARSVGAQASVKVAGLSSLQNPGQLGEP